MGELLQSIILSDVMMFFLMGLMLLLVTSWAHSRQEYAGYLLGWLTGILAMIIISAFSFGGETIEIGVPEVSEFRDPAVVFSLLVAALVGVSFGYLGTALARDQYGTQSKARRSLTIAAATSFILASSYLILLAPRPFRLVITVLVLALAIGALFNFVLSQQWRSRAVIVENYPVDGGDAQTLAEPVEPILSTSDLPSPLAQRIHNLRQRVRRYEQ